jgi:hypothetical protein
MARVSSVNMRIDDAALVKVMANLGNQAAYRMAQKLRSRVVNNMNAAGRRDTGAMARQTQVRKEPSPKLTTHYSVGTTATDPRTGFPYPIVQEKGSRGHGPVHAPFLVFTPKGMSHPISVRWVRGVKPGNFFRDALAATRATDALP